MFRLVCGFSAIIPTPGNIIIIITTPEPIQEEIYTIVNRTCDIASSRLVVVSIPRP